MREYKFRALSENTDGTKEWEYGYLQYCERKCCISDKNGLGIFADENTVGQYTGLKDANGKEIYEGDIVKQTYEWSKRKYYYLGNESYEAEEIESAFGYQLGEIVTIPSKGVCIRNYIWTDLENDISKKIKGYKTVCASRCEVIGNVHENPELLKGGAEEC